MARKLISPAGALSIALLAVAAVGVAHAVIPSADGTIHACYDNQEGALRVVDGDGPDGGRCPDTETALSWNQEGVPGPQGPAGAQGPAGPAGPAGGFKSVRALKGFSPFNDATKKTVKVNCASNEVAVGGGHNLIGSLAGRNVTISRPVGSNPPTAWVVRARSLSPVGNWRLRAFAVCAKF